MTIIIHITLIYYNQIIIYYIRVIIINKLNSNAINNSRYD